MQVFLLTVVVLLVFVIAMSVGVLFGRKPLTGSCGGVGQALGEEDYVCDLCGGDPQKCESEQQGKKADAALAYDASRK